MATAVANAEPAPRRRRFPERLPEIQGGAPVAYRLIWLLAAILAVASTTYFNYRWTVLQIAGSRIVYDTGLAPIAEPLAHAVEVAIRRQEREEQIEKRLQTIEASITKLSKALGGRAGMASLKEGRV